MLRPYLMIQSRHGSLPWFLIISVLVSKHKDSSSRASDPNNSGQPTSVLSFPMRPSMAHMYWRHEYDTNRRITQATMRHLSLSLSDAQRHIVQHNQMHEASRTKPRLRCQSTESHSRQSCLDMARRRRCRVCTIQKTAESMAAPEMTSRPM